MAAGIDAVKLADGSVTNTEFQYLDGVTSSIQNQLDAKIPLTQKGAALGVATLDAGSKIPAAQLPNTVMEYQGTWNATTNTPTLIDGTGNAGDVYRTSVAGTQNLGSGNQTFFVGDLVIYSGTIWERSPTADGVTSVNGIQGDVVLTTTNIAEGTNLYFTDERAQDAVGTILTDTTTIDFTYNDAGNVITADVIQSGLSLNSISGTLDVNKGGTGQTSYTDGQLLIGNTTGNTLTKASLTAGSGITITPGSGSITIASIAVPSAGDISETSFSAANNQAAAADVTSLAFANGTVRSFRALVSVFISATGSLYEVFDLEGVQKGASWDLAVSSSGDVSGVIFSITNAGQVQYQSTNVTGFTSNTMKFRAQTTTV